MPAKLQLVGSVFGRLRVTSEATRESRPGSFWNTVCVCGKTLVCSGGSLTSGHTTSCGCYKNELSSKRLVKVHLGNITHGDSLVGHVAREYSAWCSMCRRCRASEGETYANYRGRGISMSLEWEDYLVFKEDMGNCPEGFTLERVDNDGPYSKSNCVWASRKSQSLNRRSNILYTLNGETKPLGAWADTYSVPYHKLYYLAVTKGKPLIECLTKLK